jgi:hypothetical protein
MGQEVTISLTIELTAEETTVLRRYLASSVHFSEHEWRTLRTAIDNLSICEVDFNGRRYTFQRFYATFINGTYARPFLRQLPGTKELAQEGATLQATIARKILSWLKANGVQPATVPKAEFLIIFCLYWWAAFARGYLFEQVVIRDLQASDVQYQAHTPTKGQERYTQYDLFIPGMGNGDIKASLYFLDDLREPVADFYITQLYDPPQRQMQRIVFLAPLAWALLNGTPISATLAFAPQIFPKPVLVTILNKAWVVVQYNVWKAYVLRWQVKEDSNGR